MRLDDDDEAFMEYAATAPLPDKRDHSDPTPSSGPRGQLIALTAVSVGCAAAAVAAGSYALWLSRCGATVEALVSVHDLLETCRERVTRLEEDLAAPISHS